MKKIVINGAPDGSVKIDGQGFTDASCKTAMAPLIAALGNPDGSDASRDKAEAANPVSCDSAATAGLRV